MPDRDGTTATSPPNRVAGGQLDPGPAPIAEGTYWLAVSVLCIIAVSLGPLLLLNDKRDDWLWVIAGTTVFCPLVAYLMQRYWWLDERRAVVLNVVRHARSALEDSWEQATPSTKQEFGRHLLERLQALEQQVASARRDQLNAIEKAARETGRKRAHWLSDTCIACEGVSCVRQMELWGVPKNYVKGQLDPLLALTQTATPSAAALEQLFDEYDYWEHYTEWYVRRVLPPITLVLVALFLEGLGWALYFGMWRRQLVPGFLLAGSSGAALSILLKQSAMVVYGQLVKSWLGMAARFAMGLVATTVGFGLLGWGVVGVGFGGAGSGEAPVSLAKMVAVCSACVDEKQACIWCDGTAPAEADTGVEPAAGAPDAGAPADAGPEAASGDRAGRASALPAAQRHASPGKVELGAGKGNRPSTGTGTGKDASNGKDTQQLPCSAAWMAGLLGIGLLFGFSERAFMGILANFDSQFGAQREPTSKAPAAAAAPSAAPAGPPVATPAPARPPQNDELLDADPKPAGEDH
jgi:hypothetical protein